MRLLLFPFVIFVCVCVRACVCVHVIVFVLHDLVLGFTTYCNHHLLMVCCFMFVDVVWDKEWENLHISFKDICKGKEC